MREVTLLLLLVASAAICMAAEPKPGEEPGRSVLVSVGTKGGLAYAPYSERGDVLPDFSHCGYGGGGVPLPDAPVRETLEPQPGDGDDTVRIQAALDRVARLAPGPDGLRGAVLLKHGQYRCAGILEIAADGVVLRGEGDGTDGTVIVVTARTHQPLVRVGGSGGPQGIPGAAREVADDYVPVGARSVTLDSVEGLAVGQGVFVVRRSNAAWIAEIGMDRIPGRPGDPTSTKQWKPFDLKFDRVITAIEGRRVTFDAPIACAIERRWGGGAVTPYRDEARIERCGVEFLRAVSVFDPTVTEEHAGERVFTDEEHAAYFVAFGAVKHAWARGLTTEHFYHGPVAVGEAAKWITAEDCRSLAPVSRITGGRRSPFIINGQLTLVRRCYSEGGRHAFVFGARVPGPNVFLECRSERDYNLSEPHHRWSVGGLYDNVETPLALQDRQWMGTGHGWSGANYVAWNTRGTLVCQQPPTAQNFAIGFVGTRGREAFAGRPPGWWESEGTPVTPRSLYEAQLAARLSLLRSE